MRFGCITAAYFSVAATHSLGLGHGGSEEVIDPNEPWQVRHMRLEHGIDEFDPLSFFTLHDSDNSRTWTRDDILNLYGVQRVHQVGDGSGMGKDDRVDTIDEATRDKVVREILKLLDIDGDGIVSLDEWRKFNQAGKVLPDFGLGTGHHGDYEHEYEVHHWQKYHAENDPDVKIVHPEDEEHERLYHHVEHGDEVGEDDTFAIKIQRVPVKYRRQKA